MKSTLKGTRHLIVLRAEQERRLIEMAAAHQMVSRSGPTTGAPSFRTLIHAIADGDFRLTPIRKARTAAQKKFKASPRHPPAWWRPSSLGDMSAESVYVATGLTVDLLRASGLEVLDEDDGQSVMPPAGWKAWMPKA